MTRLNCSEFERLLEAAVEQRTAPTAEARQHAAGCPQCLVRWQDFRLLQEALDEWNARLPGVELTEAVLAAWRDGDSLRSESLPEDAAPSRTAAISAAEKKRLPRADSLPECSRESRPVRVPLSRRSGTTSRRASAGTGGRTLLVVVTATMLLAVLSLWNGSADSLRSRAPSESAAVVRSPNRSPVRSSDFPGSLKTVSGRSSSSSSPETVTEEDDLIQELRQQYALLTRDASQLVSDMRKELPGVEWRLLPETDKTPVMAPRPGQNRQTRSWQTSLEPLQRDVRKAFGFLKDAVPLWNDPST